VINRDRRRFAKPWSVPGFLHGLSPVFSKLFETGRLTSGQAARLVGMARVAFLSELGRLGVSAIQVEPEELAQDLAAAEAAAGDRR
jgi:hypothetical protein